TNLCGRRGSGDRLLLGMGEAITWRDPGAPLRQFAERPASEKRKAVLNFRDGLPKTYDDFQRRLDGNFFALFDFVPVPVAVRGGAELHERLRLLLEHQLLVILPSLRGLASFPLGLAARAQLFLRVHGDVVLALADAVGVPSIDVKRVARFGERHFLASGIDFVFAVALVPLGDG